jgi:hypothetical protein
MSDLVTEMQARAGAYQALLREEGYAAKEPEWDADARTWDIAVKYEGAMLLVILDVDDPDFVRLMLPNFWGVEPAHLGAALIAADMANKKCKAAKVFLNSAQSDTTASAEFLEDRSGRPDGAMLVRYVRMVVNAAKVYANHLREQMDAA